MQRERTFFQGRKWLLAAVSCFFVASLSACGGGGGDGGTPEMAIKPGSGPFTGAMDITGMGTVEGQIESADDEVFYNFRLDEPRVVTLQTTGEADVEITLYDSERNVLATSSSERVVTPSVSSGSGGASTQAVAAVVPIALGVGIYGIRIAPAARVAVKVGTFVLSSVTAVYAIRQIREFLELEVGLDQRSSRDLKQYFDGEESVEVAFSITPSLRTKWGTLSFSIEANHVLRVSSTGPAECGNQAEHSLILNPPPSLRWVWRQSGIPVSLEKEMPVKLLRVSAPRRKEDRPYEIAVTVQEGGSETIVLTEEIEDPEGGKLTFTHSAPPAGLGVTRDGTGLTITAREGANGGTITVTATDPDGECWNFPLRIRVGEENGGPQPGGSPSTGGSPTHGCILNSDNPLHYTVCNEHYVGEHPNFSRCRSDYRRVSQCPRTGGEFASIISCDSHFSYIHSSHPLVSLGLLRNIINPIRSECEGTFLIHK